MSASSKFAESAEHSVTCPLCYEFYADPHLPKDLECPHTCCQICLQNIVTLNPGQPITCPMKCEKKTRIPADGIENLRTNLHVKNLAEEHPNYVKGAKPAVPKCAQHGENMHLFCILCNKLTCHSCGMAYHKSSEHVIVDVCDKVEDQKKELKTATTNTMKEIQSFQKHADELKAFEFKIDSEVQHEKLKLARSVEMHIQALNEERKRLELVLEIAGEEKLREIRTERTRVEQCAIHLQYAYDVAIRTGDTSDHTYITQHKDLIDKMEKVVVENTSPKVDMKLQSAKFAPALSSATFGSIVNLVQEFGDFEYADSVALSKNGLLAVIINDCKEVLIYQKLNDKYEKILSLELNTRSECKPRGLIFCPDRKVWLARGTGIEVYSPDGKYEKIISTKFAEKIDGAVVWSSVVHVWSLAITADGSRILAGDVRRNIITIHNPAGEIRRSLRTNIKPYKMATIKNTHVAISDYTPGKQSKLSVIAVHTGLTTLCVDVPHVNAMCYDNHTDSIFTGSADTNVWHVITGTGKIEQYCWRTGRKVACIAQELYNPTAMTMASYNTLVVADEKSVKIFGIAQIL